MKQLVAKISAVALLLCTLAGVYLCFGDRGAVVRAGQFPPAGEMPAQRSAAGRTIERLAIQQSCVVELSVDNSLLTEFSPRERHDQYLDWLLFTTMSAFMPSTEEFNRATFDLPTLREGYMRPLGNFEYGETRSRFIGDGMVLALIPAKIASDSRKNDLAHIADEHRKDLGRPFDRLLVVEYELDDATATAVLTRRADIDYADLFSPYYGYVEQDVATTSDLAAFMARVDDVTAATKTTNGLTLGGRKVFGRQTRQITVEQVATVWQAEHKIQIALHEFESHAQTVVDAFNSEWRRRTYRTSSERAQLEKQQEEAWAKLMDNLSAERASLKLVNGSGFSLDPTYDFDTLVKQVSDLSGVVSALLDDPQSNNRSEIASALADPVTKAAIEKGLRERGSLNALLNALAGPLPLATAKRETRRSNLTAGLNLENIIANLNLNNPLDSPAASNATTEIANALKARDIVPLLIVKHRLQDLASSDPAAEFFVALLDFITQKNQFQVARYDGDLQGTEAGMVLFYTDLLAKIWVIDFLKSAPTAMIPGFIDGPLVPRSRIYETENRELNEGRLWFGQSDLGFQLTPSRDTILFARVATRVYSAGHNPLNPGVETETSVALGTPIVWWNDHYEEIARYEPAYEQLNQIMKWSVVFGWLNESHNGDKLGFLADVPIDRSQRLPTWATHHPELRFNQWDKIHFMPPSYKGTTAEAMPMLYGSTFVINGIAHWLEGGVSLAPKQIFKGRASIAPELDRTLLRSNINYGAESAAGRKLTTFENAVYTFSTREPNVVTLSVRAKPEAKLRAKTAELANTDVQRVIVRGDDAVRLETRLSETPIGDLEIAQANNGFRVGWWSRELDKAHTIARRMSLAANPADVLARDPDVVAVFILSDKGDFLVQLRDSDHWFRFAAEDTPTRNLPQDWLMRAADYSQAKRDLRVAAMDFAKARDLIGPHAHLAIETVGDDSKIVVHVVDRDPPTGTGQIDVDTGAGSVKAWVDPQTDAVHIAVAAHDLPGGPVSFVRQFGRPDLAAIRAASRSKDVHRIRLNSTSGERSRLVADAERDNARQAALDIASDPVVARQAVDRQLAAELITNTSIREQHGSAQAIRHLNKLVRLYGPQPELTLRRGLLHIDANRWSDAVSNLGRPHRPMRGREMFFEEINHRLANQRLSTRARVDLYRYAEYADFQDSVLTRYRDLGDIVLPEYRNDAFDFALQVGKTPDVISLKTIDFDKVRSGRVVVYRQDTPALNNLDWNVSIEHTLQQVIEGRLGKVVQLPRGDIAHFRPSAIYNPDTGTTLHRVDANSHFHVPTTTSYSACNPGADSCPNEPANDNSAEQVYFVMES